MMTYHQYSHALVVMDGKRIVAVGRERLSRGWLLHLNGASWLDHRARRPSRVTRKVDPSHLLVKTRMEAEILLIQLVSTGRNPN